MARIVHVLWSPQTGPICAYEDLAVAFEHAQAMLGVEVSAAEFRTEPPDFVRSASVFNDGATTIIAIEDIADAKDADRVDAEEAVEDDW